MWDDERDMGKAILYANQRIRTLVPQVIVQHYSLNVEIRLTEQHDDEWSRLFALKKVPCLVTESKQKLTEVIAIMYYLVNLIPDQPTRDVLLGADFSAKAQILHYLWLANCGFCMPMATCLLQIQGVIPYFKPDFDRARAAMDKIAESYERHLKEQKYLTGNDITLADLFTAAIFTRALQYMYGEEWRESHPAITSWFYDVTDTPILRDFYKDFAPCKEAVKPAKAK